MDYFDKAIEFGNLYRALKECCRNVRWKDSVVGYEANGLRNTLKLLRSVKDGTYKIDPYQKFIVHEPKEREIVATRIKDRQLQRAVCNAGLYEELTRSFIVDNTACQTGKGTDFTIKRIKMHMVKYRNRNGTDGWVLKCDIHHFFQSTPHSVAKNAVAKRVSDVRARQLVFDVIDSFGGDTGIGLGSQISQLVELAVLDDLDHYIKERLGIKFYVRYMDDFILIHPDKDYLLFCLQEIRKKVEEIGLSLNEKTSIQPLKHGFVFCKWRYRYTDTGKIVVTIDRKKLSNQRHKIRKLLEKEISGERPTGTAITSLRSWEANANRGESYKDIKNMYTYFNKTLKELKDENRKKKRC